MSVEEVHVPGKVMSRDPKMAKEKGGAKSYYENATAEARAKREFLEEQRMTDQIINPPEPPEPPFSVRGSVNLGDLDLQADRRAAEERAAQERADSQARLDAAMKEKEDLKDKMNEVTMAREVDRLMAQLKSNEERLNAVIEGKNKSSGDFFDEFERLQKIAGMLGWNQAPAAAPTGNPSMELELKKYDIQLERERQKWEIEKENNRREWEMRSEELKMKSQEAQARINAEREKLQTFSAIPERIGGVFAKAIIDGTRDKSGGVSSGGGNKSVESKVLGTIEAGLDEEGNTDCPNCGAQIFIPKKVTRAVCAGCRGIVNIVRKTPKAPQGGAPTISIEDIP